MTRADRLGAGREVAQHRIAEVASGSVATGFDMDRWTWRRIAQVAEREVGVGYHSRSRSRVLHARG